jgi:DNA-binding transcriptional MerR regulator
VAHADAHANVEIPDKLYFRIGEVAQLLGVKPYVLRFWESEFPCIKPLKSAAGQRLYRRRDVELLTHVKRLLWDEGFTIAGARRQLDEFDQFGEVPAGAADGAPPVEAVSSPVLVGDAASELIEDVSVALGHLVEGLPNFDSDAGLYPGAAASEAGALARTSDESAGALASGRKKAAVRPLALTDATVAEIRAEILHLLQLASDADLNDADTAPGAGGGSTAVRPSWTSSKISS